MAMCRASNKRRTGEATDDELRAVTQLNEGQRALFLFQVLYGHASHGISSFFLQISYLTETLDIWSALRSAMKYFDDAEMLRVIEAMEAAYCSKPESSSALPIDELDRLYKERVPATVRRIGAFIRSHPEIFLQSKGAGL